MMRGPVHLTEKKEALMLLLKPTIKKKNMVKSREFCTRSSAPQDLALVALVTTGLHGLDGSQFVQLVTEVMKPWKFGSQ